MSEGTKIQWADDTQNFWRGCTKVSPGCKNCYAERNIGVKMHGVKWGHGAARVRASDATFNATLKWNKRPWVCDDCGRASNMLTPSGFFRCPQCESRSYHRRRVFSLSLGDWLDDEAPIEWLADMLDVIRRCRNLNFLLLTKRPENFFPLTASVIEYLHSREPADQAPSEYSTWLFNWHARDDAPPHNIWLGVSVEDQPRADERIPQLIKIPAAVRFLSVEPMLGPVDLSRWCSVEPAARSDAATGRTLHWVIFGGESGPGARPCNIEWIRDGVRQCRAAGVAPFVKQLGDFCVTDEATPDGWPVGTQLEINPACTTNALVKLHDKKGGDPSEWPDDLRLREFPTPAFLPS